MDHTERAIYYVDVRSSDGNLDSSEYHLPGQYSYDEVRAALVQAGFQPYSDIQSVMDRQAGTQRAIVNIWCIPGVAGGDHFGPRNLSIIGGSIHEFYRPDADFDQTVQSLQSTGFEARYEDE